MRYDWEAKRAIESYKKLDFLVEKASFAYIFNKKQKSKLKILQKKCTRFFLQLNNRHAEDPVSLIYFQPKFQLWINQVVG